MLTLARLRTYAWKSALVLAIIVGGLWTATHGVAGVAWKDVVGVIRGVDDERLLLLTGIWVGGLAIYSVVLAAALPGLGVRRSLVLNLSGSAIANAVPLGGAAATALNWRMVKTWGHSDRAFVAFCILTNALDVASKLLLPVVAVGVLVMLSMHVPGFLWAMSALCVGSFVLAFLLRLVLRRTRLGRAAPARRWHAAVRSHLRDSGARMRAIFADQWTRLVPASLAYVAAQVVLFDLTLRSVGLAAPLTVVLTAAAIERLGTLIPITPGGTGVAEVGTIAWLVAAGQDPVLAVAGVLLYRVFLIVMEIPVGGLVLGAWAWLHRGSGSSAAGAAAA